jgi:hypothetical protein
VSNTAVKQRAKALSLKELLGQTITIVGIEQAPEGAETKRFAVLGDGQKVWLPNHVEFDEQGAAGRYVVTSFNSKRWGKTGYGIENAPD